MERRQSPRRRVLKGATIAFNHASRIACMVRNMSDTGACLDIECPIGIPETFTLVMDADSTARASRIVWKSGRRIGVAFH